MKKTNAAQVLEAMEDLHNREQTITREVLAAETGMEPSIIDNALSHLIDSGLAHRIHRGVFAPALSHPPARPITRTLLPDGTTVLEIGDHVIHLTPRESRMMGEQFAGSAQSYNTIGIGRQVEQLTGDIARQLKELKKGQQQKPYRD